VVYCWVPLLAASGEAARAARFDAVILFFFMILVKEK
jgi:hypothetical protein